MDREKGRLAENRRDKIITNVTSNTTMTIPGELLTNRSNSTLKINCQSRLKTEKENLAVYM